MLFLPVFLVTLLVCAIPVALAFGLLGGLARVASGIWARGRDEPDISPIDWPRFERDLRAYASPSWTRARETERRT